MSVNSKNKQKLSIKQKLAFTLAEVLIVVGIIGIIAEITIPTVVASAQKTATVSMLKKNYSVLTLAYNSAVQENGPFTQWGLAGTPAAMTTVFQNMFAPYLKVTEFCGTTPGNCWAYGTYFDGTSGTAGCPPVIPANQCIFATLADGSSMAFYDRTGVYTPTTVEIMIIVDLNGLKAPNKMGKDRFGYFIENDNFTDYKLAPMGNGPNNVKREACWDSTQTPAWWLPGKGWTCALTIIKFDGWQIKDDYPW